MEKGRSKDRRRKTLSFPNELEKAIQVEADAKFGGDFTRALIDRLAKAGYKEAVDFLKQDTKWKHSSRKV